jgi:hypothetical protein
MFLAHSFRLRDPWQCECGENAAMRWSRVFHKPTGLEPDDALWLVCSGLPAEAAVSLNGVALTPGVPLSAPSATGVPPVPRQHQYEVTALLKEANRIELQVPSDLQPPASSLQPDSFPYDVRLGVVGHS